jgi:hypothetical protein
MNRLPVGQTIRFAYAFTFGEIGTILGLIWLPTVLNAVGSFVVFGLTGGGAPDGGGMPAGPQLALLMLYFVMAFLLGSMMAVAVTSQALGLRKGPALVHFSLGSAEMRVFGGLFGLYLLLILFFLAFAIVIALAAVVAGAAVAATPALQAVGAVAAAALGAAGLCALVYVFVRLSFLFIPSAVVDGEFGLTRSWELTKGNFWRIFLVGLGVLLPLLLVQAGTEYFILGPRYLVLLWAMLHDGANAARYSAEQAQIVQARLPLLLGMSLIFAPLTQGLLFAPAAFAYRVLSGKALVESKE